jgi:2'-5' RNA ligase
MPFHVRTAGLGIFTGPLPVLYLTVARCPALAALHARLWRAMAGVAEGVSPWYSPEQWHPHVSLGLHDLDADSLGAIVQRLAERDFHWTIPIDSLAVIAEGETSQVIGCRFGLSRVSEVR